MAELLRSCVQRDPHGAALTDEAGSTSWTQLQERTNRLVDLLRRSGVRPGERVAVHSGNRREVYELAMACLHAGFFVLQTNWNYTSSELAFVLQDSGATALVADDVYAQVAGEAVASVPACAARFVMGDATVAGFTSYEQALAASSPEEPADQVAGAAMFYTSGTTGQPKGILPAGLEAGRPVSSLVPTAQGVRQGLGLPEDGRSLLIGPIYHSGQWAMTTYPLLCGVPVTMLRFPDPERVLDTIERERVTHGVFNPVDFVRLLKLPQERREQFDSSSLVQVVHGGAPCAPDVKRRMIDWWGPIITEYYGASEGGLFALASSQEWQSKPGSVGRVLPFLECRIVPEGGGEAAPGEEGLIYVRHRSGADFAYHNQPEKTAEAHLEPGLFTLGDVGYLDEDGYLYLSDRKSEVINSGSVKIYPAEIEKLLAGHPAVDDVAVLGVPDPELGEQVKAAVKVSAGSSPGPELAEELIAHVAAVLAPYKVPRSVDFFDELPRTDAGKLAKASLRERYWQGAGRRI